MKIQLKQPYSFCQIGKRANQEDARFPDSDVPCGSDRFFVVCDVVGGQDKGEVASRTVADAIGDCMSGIDLSDIFTYEDFRKVLDHAFSSLSKQISKETQAMATTMTFVCFHAGGVFCAHMGDSRIYHIRPGVGILYQSEDHSLVNELVHSGNLTPEEAIGHSRSNVITRCIRHVEKGLERPAATTLQIEDVEEGDYFFLCTDGVLNMIDDGELFSLLSSDESDKDKIRLIADKSFGSPDNNTAYLIGIGRVEDTASRGSVSYKKDYDVNVVDTAPLGSLNMTAIEVIPSVETTGQKIIRFFKDLFS